MEIRIKKYSFIALSVLALFSCTKEEHVELSGGNDIVKAVIENVGTKSYFGADGLITYWSAGDQLGIYTLEKGGNIVFTAASASDAYNGIFKGTLNGGTPMYAYYPYTVQSGNFDAVEVNLSPEQDSYNISDYDFKACVQSGRNNGNEFQLNFKSVLSVLYVTFNAAGTSLENSSLKSIKVQALPVNDGDNMPALTGNFTMNLQEVTTSFTGTTYDYAKLVWKTPLVLSEGIAKGYMFVNPDAIKVGTPLVVTFETEAGTTVTANYTSTKDCKANTRYDFNLVLAESGDDVVYEGNPFATLTFTQSANSGKLLQSSKFEKSYSNKYYENTTERKDIVCTYNETEKVWEAVIPYLYDFNGLIPSFTTVEEDAKVYVNGVEQISGKTAIDFSNEVTYIVETAAGARQGVKVRVKNTGLPVVTITGTNGQAPYSKSTDFDEIEGTFILNINGAEHKCGVRLRGNTTQDMPKKPYAIKLDSKAEILGMPKHKRWVLLANWMDRTMLRNDLAFYLARQTGAWAPNGIPVELVLNSVHVGNYYLCEQIKIDEKRVNIAEYGWEDLIKEIPSPTDDDIAAKIGFLLECDQSADQTEIYFQNTSPVKFYTYIKDPGDVADLGNGKNPTAAYTYIKNYFTNVGKALSAKDWTTVANMIDYKSFADYWLFSEITENQESKHPKSFYMHKDAGGKLCAGPAWDYDWGTFIPMNKMPSNGENSSTAGKYQNYFSMRYTMWYQQLFNDPAFKAIVKERWAELSGKFATAVTYLDQRAAMVKLSDTFNHVMWPIEGMLVNSYYLSMYNWPNCDEKLVFEDAISQMRAALQARLAWMETQVNAL